ncbi:MAG: metal ABC transporter solute-binding protein, Zn/Mn family [Muribaculaceae bacterium]
MEKTKRRIVKAFAAAAAAAWLLMASCVGRESRKPVIAVSIQPQKWLLEQIVGERYEVVSLLSGSSNPETYEPDMNHLMSLERSCAYFCIGNIGFEMAIVDKARANNPKIEIVNTGEGIERLSGTHCGVALQHSVEGHSGCEQDPHVWTSVKNARVIAANMCRAVARLDERHAAEYEGNLTKLLERLNQLDGELRKALGACRGKAFVVWHPSLSYFAADYGLQQIGMEYEGKEMPAKVLKEEIDYARACQAKVFFLQKEFDSRQAAAVNEQIGAKMVSINLMNYDWDKELLHIANALREAENN